jgi:TatD DNase family protein
MKITPETSLELIDTHVHLDMIPSVRTAVEKARAAHISKIVAVGMNLSSNQKTLDLAGRFPGVVLPAIGYHPWAIVEEDMDETVRFVDTHLAACIALGEVGLDYKIKIKKRIQQQVFESLLALAAKHQKPVNVHSRYSFERAHAMLRQAGIEKAVFHWYSGPLDILDRIIDSGYFISATPALAYSSRHRAAVERAPMNQILIETDAPEKYQGEVSEPATLLTTLGQLAQLKKLTTPETARVTTGNARYFYGL